MKTKLYAFFICFGTVLFFNGCATMAENRQANAALNAEMENIASIHQQKFLTTKPILIIGHNTSRPNSVGGVDMTLTFQNRSGKRTS